LASPSEARGGDDRLVGTDRMGDRVAAAVLGKDIP
jgi:hypothetical protein